MKKNIVLMISLLLLQTTLMKAQTKRACDLVDVATINSILGSTLTYDATSIINKSGKFECRFTDPKSPSKYVSVNLLQSKVQYGYDMLKTDFDGAKTDIAAGKKAIGRYSKFFAYANGGANSFYLTAPQGDWSPESFVFKFRKGDYIISVATEYFSSAEVTAKIDALYKALIAKL